MSVIDNLSKSVAICSCGICCSMEYLCSSCVKRTLMANGLPDSLAKEIENIPHRERYGHNQIAWKIKNLLKILEQ